MCKKKKMNVLNLFLNNSKNICDREVVFGETNF